MPVIPVLVRGRFAAPRGMPQIVCGNSSYVLHFDFDSEWDAFPQKTACLRYRKHGAVCRQEIVFTGSTCPLPPLTEICEVLIGVTAGTLCTTTPARIPCALSVTDLPAAEALPIVDLFNPLAEAVKTKHLPVPTGSGCFLIDAAGCLVLDSTGAVMTVKE